MSSIARVKLRSDTAANWTSANPILALGEAGVETDTRSFKVGDGTTAWTALPYLVAAGDSATVVRKYVRNNSGVSIPKGAAVYQTGSSGTTLTVALADASLEATASQTLGLAQETIGINANGYVIAVGQLDGISTATLTEGQIVWLSETAGQLTTTRPTQPAHGVVCGYCVKQAAGSAGILYVKVDNGLELGELHDVLVTGATTGQFLRKDSDGLWKGHTLSTLLNAPAYTVATLPTPPVTGTVVYVTNATAPTLGAIVVGGGAATARVWYNGAAWRVIGV
jgi:hypothetical protein